MIGCLLTVAVVLLGQTPSAADADLKPRVRALIQQLDAETLPERDAAEENLKNLGPDALDLLAAKKDASPEVQERLKRIRKHLQDAAVEATAHAATITLPASDMPLSKVLQTLSKQCGNKIVDFRERYGQPAEDPVLHVMWRKTPFWQALDEALDQAGLGVCAGEAQAVNVAHRPQRQRRRVGTAAYVGPLRIEPVTIESKCDLRNSSSRSLKLTLDIAWEPRIKPIYFKQKLSELSAVDDQGKAVPVDGPEATIELPIRSGLTTAELEIPLLPPPRDVIRLGRLKGKLTALLPGLTESFRFERVAAGFSGEKRIAGVVVKVDDVRQDNGAWEFRVRACFDQPGDALESHRGWKYENEAYLEGADGRRIDFGTSEAIEHAGNEIGTAYIFPIDKLPEGCVFVYRTPAAMITATFEYELKDIPLP